MKKPNQLNNYDSDNADQENLYWEQKLSEENDTSNTEKTDHEELKSKAKRKKARKSIRQFHEDDYMED